MVQLFMLLPLASVDMQIHEAAIIDGATFTAADSLCGYSSYPSNGSYYDDFEYGKDFKYGYEKILAMQNQIILVHQR